MLCDEPIASLDPKSSRVTMEMLRWVSDELGVACLVNLHQVDYAIEYSDRIVALKKGVKVFDGTPDELDAKTISDIYGTPYVHESAHGVEGKNAGAQNAGVAVAVAAGTGAAGAGAAGQGTSAAGATELDRAAVAVVIEEAKAVTRANAEAVEEAKAVTRANAAATGGSKPVTWAHAGKLQLRTDDASHVEVGV